MTNSIVPSKYNKTDYGIALLSGGLGSFLATYLYKASNPSKKVIGYFTDTRQEDLDTYRFLTEGAEYLGVELIRDADGRDPWQVFEDTGFIGNSRVPKCSIALKIQQRINWLAANCEPGIDMIIGFDWTEIHRVERAQLNEKFANIVAPLVDDLRDKKEIYNSLDRPPQLPELYELGFPHSNCGGCCVQAGQSQWALVLEKRPESYMWHELRMEDIMSRNPNLKPFLRVTVDGELKYLTLKQFRELIESKAKIAGSKPLQMSLDFGGCGCAFN